MPTIDALWMANGNGEPAMALPPLGAKPVRLDLTAAGATLSLACGTEIRLAGRDAEEVRGIAGDRGRIAVFEVDRGGTVRRSTFVSVAAGVAA